LLEQCWDEKPRAGTRMALPSRWGKSFDAGQFVTFIAWNWRPATDDVKGLVRLSSLQMARLERHGPPWLKAEIERWRSGMCASCRGHRSSTVGQHCGAANAIRTCERRPPAAPAEPADSAFKIDALLDTYRTSRPLPGARLPLGPPGTPDAGKSFDVMQFLTGVALNWRPTGDDRPAARPLSRAQMRRMEDGPPWLRAEIERWRRPPCAVCREHPHLATRSRCGGRHAPLGCRRRPVGAELDAKMDALFEGCRTARPPARLMLPLTGYDRGGAPAPLFDAHKFLERVAPNWRPPGGAAATAHPSHALTADQMERAERRGTPWFRALVERWRVAPCGACRAHPDRKAAGRCGVRNMAFAGCERKGAPPASPPPLASTRTPDRGGGEGPARAPRRKRARGAAEEGAAAAAERPPARPRPVPPARPRPVPVSPEGGPGASDPPSPREPAESPARRAPRRSARLIGAAVRPVPPPRPPPGGGGARPPPRARDAAAAASAAAPMDRPAAEEGRRASLSDAHRAIAQLQAAAGVLAARGAAGRGFPGREAPG